MPEQLIPGEADERGWGMNAWRVLRRRWPVLLLATILGAVLGAVPGRLSDPVYTSEVTFVVQPNPTVASAETTIRTAVAVLRSAEMTRLIAETPTITLTEAEITDGLVVERPPGSGLLSAQFSHKDREVSDEVAQILRSSYPQVIAGLAIDNAFVVRGLGDVNSSTQSAPWIRDAFLAGILALVLAVVAVALIEQRSRVIRNPAQFIALDIPLLATIPSNRSRPVSDAGIHAIVTAAKRTRSWPNDPTTILIAGAESSKERAQLATAIAASLAAGGRETVLLDLDGTGPGAANKRRFFPGRSTAPGQTGTYDSVSFVAVPAQRINSFLHGSYVPLNVGLNVISCGPQHYNEWGWLKIQERVSIVTERGGVVVALSAPVPDGGLVQPVTAAADAILFAAVTDTTTDHDARLAYSCLHALSHAPIECVLLRADQFELLPAPTTPRSPASTAIAPIESARRDATGWR
jgi:capsular polysaccharide biosynthesis protein